MGRKDALDMYIETCEYLAAQQHSKRVEEERQQGGFVRPPRARAAVPDELKFRYDVFFKPSSLSKRLSARDVKADSIGRLVSLRAMVSRISEVKPMLSVATYTCDRCGVETYQPIRSPSFMPLTACPSKECVVNRSANTLSLQSKGSKFLKFQEIRVQELSEQVPVGGIPRSLVVWCVGENTRQCQPGDYVDVSGVFMPVQKQTPYRQMMQGLLTDVALVAHQVTRVSKGDDDDWETTHVTNTTTTATTTDARLLGTGGGGGAYELLAASFAPEIFGHEDVKKALILLLVGGVDHKSKGMKIRGNINICLMGDPGVAKSQLLCYINRLALRSQYTTGRGSSGVGLTAAVLKDPTTNEMILEGGALVLADGGVCCIDEFDKMSETDRTAIHEVMEQQTISVAKAGILTSLNARVSILAAANPAYGRYNIHKTVAQNVQLPAALLSRFDVLWLMQDKPNHDFDFRLAKHIVHVHQHEREPNQTDASNHLLDMRTIRQYIAACKQINTRVSQELFNFIIAAYVQMREEARNERNKKIRGYTSARTLLAILRLSSAHARIRMSENIERQDVEEAIRLMDMSKQSLVTDPEAQTAKLNDVDQIFQLLRDMLPKTLPAEESQRRAVRSVKFDDALERCLARGFTSEQFNKAIKEYDNLDVIQLSEGGTQIVFI